MEKIKYEGMTLARDDGEDGYTVTECEKDVREILMPARINGVPIIAIGEWAFAGCAALRRVVFCDASEPDGAVLREIGDHAFSECSALAEIDLPESVSTISYGAFYRCVSLVSARFSSGAYVGSYAFAHCDRLRTVSPTRYASEGAFSHCACLTDLPLAAPVSEIDEDAFEHCDSLVDITIPASVRRLGSLAFRGCARLARVTFAEPNGWVEGSVYTGKTVPIDLRDPEQNAKRLVQMDFDDGVSAWTRIETKGKDEML